MRSLGAAELIAFSSIVKTTNSAISSEAGQLRRFAVEIALTSDSPPRPRLEALVLGSVPMPNVVQWREQMKVVERGVCRIEAPIGYGIGTGFLVGPRVVLTNSHVLREIEARNLEARQMGVRFDYAE